ncbi:MAG TPA: radical SAM family heme chaperone HemW [Nitrospinota bacterium]|nr:radical SAM family heme chaperone HemW [Nitrospinota bacterium]
MRKKIGIYIHFPFCIKKCGYCDFNSYSNMEGIINEYVEAVKKEISLISCQPSALSLQPYEIISIFFGGGTPTMLESGQLVGTLNFCKESFNLKPNAEITIEANPETLTIDKLKALKKGGFNRISIGVQSFNDKLLKKLGRVHDSKKAYQGILSARDAGFKNISIDLMFGIPDETIGDWESDIKTAIELNPEHISTYNLTIEKGTQFWSKTQAKACGHQLPDEDKQLEMYERGIELLTMAGYGHYEISNFAKHGKKCLHNQIYWQNEEYIGMGAGAYSYINGERRWNIKSLVEYIKRIQGTKEARGQKVFNVIEGEEKLENRKTMGETIMMGLRMLDGINLQYFKKRFGVDLKTVFSDTISQLLNNNLIVFDNGNLKLTQKGLLFYNDVSVEFLS